MLYVLIWQIMWHYQNVPQNKKYLARANTSLAIYLEIEKNLVFELCEWVDYILPPGICLVCFHLDVQRAALRPLSQSLSTRNILRQCVHKPLELGLGQLQNSVSLTASIIFFTSCLNFWPVMLCLSIISWKISHPFISNF